MPEPGSVFLVRNSPVIVQECPAAIIYREHVGIVHIETSRYALGISIVIPASYTGIRDNGLESLNTRGSNFKRERPTIRTTCHSDVPVGPIRLNGNPVGPVRIGKAVAGEPFYNTFVAFAFQIRTAELKAFRSEGANTAGLYNGEAADQIVVV